MEVMLTFVLDEDVTPDLFAAKVAFACSKGCLRPGEGVRQPSNPSNVYLVTDEPFEWPPR